MPDDTVLCGKKGTPEAITVGDCKNWAFETDHGWSKKPDFIRRRLYERYVDPVFALNGTEQLRGKKHGFYVMAVSCLLIETLVSFWRGWETTEPYKDASGKKVRGKSGKAFKLFFRVQPRFRSLRDKPF